MIERWEILMLLGLLIAFVGILITAFQLCP